MAIQKKNSSITMLIVGAIIGVIAGAFLPDKLSPLALFKKSKK